MKITYDHANECLLSDVVPGTAFKLDGHHYMKTERFHLNKAYESVNAVSLLNGSLYHFADDTKVGILDVELIVKQ